MPIIKYLYNIWALRVLSAIVIGDLCGGLMTHTEVLGQAGAKVAV